MEPQEKVALRVLVVEDSADDAKLLVRALTKQGFRVTSQRVETREAMRAALEAEPWDLILADHSMPAFSSLDALGTLKQTGLDLPFIIVSGLIGEEIAVEAMKAGAHDYIMKGSMARLAPAITRELADAKVRRERKQADEALLVAYAELERRVEERTAELARVNQELLLHQARELAALKELDIKKEEFLSVAAHELRTPVTTVLGFAQTMLRLFEKRGSLEPERLSRGLHTIVVQSQKLAALVSQLLDTSRIESGRLALDCQCVDLVRLACDVVNTASQAKGRRDIRIQAPERADARVDPIRIEQVITNLVNNAIQYALEGPIEVSLVASDGSVEIAVRDHGKGISAEHLPHIFERFYQANERQHSASLGLGLYISSQIVALHGGKIRVEAPPDGGTRFVVTLPSCVESSAEERNVLLEEDYPVGVKRRHSRSRKHRIP